MKIAVEKHNGKPVGLVVTREAGDPAVSGNGRLLYQIKARASELLGAQLIKKLMWKDGHLVSDHKHYLRSRHQKAGRPIFAVTDDQWNIRSIESEYNRTGQAWFKVQDIGVYDGKGA